MLLRLVEGLGGRAVFYGMGEGAEVRAVHVTEVGAEGVVFTVEANGERASVHLKMLGRHNVPNALAAIAVGLRSGDGAWRSVRRQWVRCGQEISAARCWNGAARC